MEARDYDEAAALWSRTEGMGLSASDSRESIEAFLRRNPGLSLVARDGPDLVAAVLCGHDGRRGHLYHLAVAQTHRRKGLGRALVDQCLAGLRSQGIRRCYLLLLNHNDAARAFYRALGWIAPDHCCLMAIDILPR